MTVQDILIRWLKNQTGEFKQSQIETELPSYGEYVFGTLHTPGTYSRVFRQVKEQKLMYRHGLEIEDISFQYPHRKEKTYKVISILAEAV